MRERVKILDEQADVPTGVDFMHNFTSKIQLTVIHLWEAHMWLEELQCNVSNETDRTALNKLIGSIKRDIKDWGLEP